MERENIEVVFHPDEKWWQFWKIKRKLIEGKHYTIENGCITFKKSYKGTFDISYDVILNYNLNKCIHLQ